LKKNVNVCKQIPDTDPLTKMILTRQKNIMNPPEHEKSTAALKSVFAAIFLTGFKIMVGVFSGSLGILAEAAHSGLDLVAALVTFFAVRASGKPADRQHPYGHGKIENLSALFEALLLLLTCAWIIKESIHRLIYHSGDVNASLWTFAVMLVSIGVDFSRSRMLLRVARKHKSQALEADALHFSTDIWSSSVVIVGLIGVKLAACFPPLHWLIKMDSVAALAVGGIVVWVSARMGWRTILELLDTAPLDLDEKIKQIAESVANVKNCHAVRIRCAGPETFIDAHLVLEGNMPLSEAHRITDLVEEAIRKEIPGAGITVHAEPLAEPPPAAADIRAR
jgi:cation diffusion facilitator family transporter